MSRNSFDQKCTTCGESYMQLIGEPARCTKCGAKQPPVQPMTVVVGGNISDTERTVVGREYISRGGVALCPGCLHVVESCSCPSILDM